MGTAVLTDFMPWTADRQASLSEVHRMIEVRDGSLEISVVFDPRFDYARGSTRIEVTEHGAIAIGPQGERLTISITPGAHFEPRASGGVEARFPLAQRPARMGCSGLGSQAPGTHRSSPSLRIPQANKAVLASVGLPASLRRPLATRRPSVGIDPENVAVRPHRGHGRGADHEPSGLSRWQSQLGLPVLVDP